MSQYILDANKQPIPCDDMYEWSAYMTDEHRRVKLTVIGPKTVSTVFLGTDHNYFVGSPPILFETMVFDKGATGWQDEICERYISWDDAVAGHDAIVNEIFAAQSISIGKMLGL